MARRKEDGFLELIFDWFKAVPFWVGPVLAVVVFLACRFGLPRLFPEGNGAGNPAVFYRLFYAIFSWMLSGIILLAWIAAEIHKFLNRRRLDGQSGIGSIRELSWGEFELLIAEAYRRKGYFS